MIIDVEYEPLPADTDTNLRLLVHTLLNKDHNYRPSVFDLAKFPAPAGASETSAFAMNMVALGELSDKFETYVQVLIDRALDIARGGNGRIAAPAKEEEQTA